MTNPKPSAPAPSGNTDRRRPDTAATDRKGQKPETSGKEEMPGAEGPLSAGASEDTYD